MSQRTKSRRPAKSRKKSPERPGHEAPHETRFDPAYLELEEAAQAKEDRKRSSGRRDAFSLYMADVAAAPELMNADEEREQAVLIKRAQSSASAGMAKRLLAAQKLAAGPPDRRVPKARLQEAQRLIKTFNPSGLSGKELKEHLDKLSISEWGLVLIEEHDRDAYRVAERFINANLRLVINLARRYAFHGYMSLEDLVQEGNVGLVIGTLRFDPARGFRFSTYASWWIRHAIGRGMADKGRTVRLPVHMIDFSQEINRARRAFIDRHERLPSDEELCEAAGCTLAKLRLLAGGLQEPRSLDEPIDDERGVTFGDTLAAKTREAPEWATLIPGKEQHIIQEAFRSLKPMERDILRLRFGLTDEEELTLREIGDRYSLSRERIRQLEVTGLRKLKLILNRRLSTAV